MRTTRFYQDTALESGQTLLLTDEASHHLQHVLRLKPGDTLTVFNGQGGEYTAHVTAIQKRSVEIQLDEFQDLDCESPLSIQLIQCIARGDRMDTVIQKAVELGVSQVTPVMSEHCQVKLNAIRATQKHAHWQAVSVHACQQSGRNRLPMIDEPVQLNTALNNLNEGLRICLDPTATQTLSELPNSADKITLIIGPEGGFSNKEITLLAEHHFVKVKLGPRILRTETAAIVATSLIQARFGDLNF